jgi:predicted lipoprotein with Yx(FWY)xxD motif
MRTLTIIAGLLTIAALTAPAGGATPTGTVSAHASRYGTVLFDGRGFALYAFTKDPSGKSACYGDCAKAWPPYLIKAEPAAALGAKASLLGTTRRADRTTQVTYAGRPLYYYIGDRRPRQILCQNVSEFGGTWLVVRPSGSPVR